MPLTGAEGAIQCFRLPGKGHREHEQVGSASAKLIQVMLECDHDKLLGGKRIEVDDAYIGDELSGGKRGPAQCRQEALCGGRRNHVGRQASAGQGQPGRWLPAHLDQALGGPAYTPHGRGRNPWPQGLLWHLLPSSVSQANRERADAGCTHQPIVTGSGKKAVKNSAFMKANTLFGDLKTSLAETDHAIHEKHVPRYLAQFQYRFNRRYDLPTMILRLG